MEVQARTVMLNITIIMKRMFTFLNYHIEFMKSWGALEKSHFNYLLSFSIYASITVAFS